MIAPKPPLVSIVTPTFNSARYLEDLLRSVEKQDYPRIEHIVIDDGSTDNGATVTLLRRYPNVRWWSRDNRGQYATMNEGFLAAAGDFITTISSDDTYADPRAVRAMAEMLAEHAEYDVVHGDTLHTDQDGTVLPIQPYQRYPAWMVRYNLGCIFHCSMLIRREKLIADGLLFDESLRYVADADWLVRMYLKKYRFRRIDRYIGAYRHHDDQVTAIATADPVASAARLAEHAEVFRRYRANTMVKRLVAAYDTFHQRRVKLLGAWRHGGGVQVAKLASNWIRRR
jgi:glycosyltransferase involved in cell wall biosynthesis